MTFQLPAGVVLPMPVVLAAGAAVVMVTAAVLTNRSATRPELPAQRWYRPLPSPLAAATDHVGVRVVLRIGLLVAAVLLGLAATGDTSANGRVVLAGIVALAVLTGPLPSIANPARLALLSRPDDDVTVSASGVGWPAVIGLAVLSAVVLTVDAGGVLAAVFGAHLLVQAALTRRNGGRWPPRGDALDAVATVTGHVAPVGRARDGRFAWRNPVVNAAHAAPGPAAVGLTAVMAGVALTGAATGGSTSPLRTLSLFAVVTFIAAGVVRAGVIRTFFLGAVAPLAAAYGLLAGGRWLPPLDLVVFVTLHAVAIAVLHRQAIARHDARAARALQFPPRTMVVVSVLAGLAVFAPA